MARSPANKSNEQMRRYRDRMRAKGLRPVQLWVPDTRAPGFAEKVRQQSLRAAAAAEEQEVLEFIEAVFDWPES